LQAYVSEFDGVAVAERSECVFRLSLRAQVNRGAGALAQFQVPGYEIGVEVGKKNVLDGQPVLGGECEVLVHVALRINYGGGTRTFVANQVGGVRQAREI
jgi:hypothetical protein